jgi:hypothetical protein
MDLVHSIHTSERKSFRACRLRWNWIFREYWYPRITARPLEFGVAYHKAMEIWYEPKTWHLTQQESTRAGMVQAAIAAFNKVCEEQRANYLKSDQAFLLTTDAEADYDERIVLGREMLNYHLGTVSPREDKGLTPVHVEIKFEVPVVNPKTGEQLICRCNTCWDRWFVDLVQRKPGTQSPGRGSLLFPDGIAPESWRGLPVTYGGRIDCIMQDELGRYWLVDWKTAARLSPVESQFLLIEDQITSYCWAVEFVLNIKIAGFIWHEQKKAVPEPPEPNKHQYKGRWYSTNKTTCNAPYDLYVETITENDFAGYDSGAYDEFLEWLKENEPEFYRRHRQLRNQHELAYCAQQIFDEASDIIDPDLRIYPNQGRFGCESCAFAQPHMALTNGEDLEYTLSTLFEKRQYHYYEVAPPTTEGAGRAAGADA